MYVGIGIGVVFLGCALNWWRKRYVGRVAPEASDMRYRPDSDEAYEQFRARNPGAGFQDYQDFMSLRRASQSEVRAVECVLIVRASNARLHTVLPSTRRCLSSFSTQNVRGSGGRASAVEAMPRT